LTVREEIARQIKFDYLHEDLDYSYINLADKVIKIITKKLDEKIKETEKYNWVLFSYSEVLQDFKRELEK